MAWPLPLVLGFSSVGSMAYVYYGVLRLPRGLTRLTATIPLIAFYMYMPLTFNTVFMRGVYSFFFVWLTSFKLALLCWDEGPAADPWAVASFPRFIAVMNLSLHLKRQKFSEREKERIVTANLRLKRKSSPEMVNGSGMATSDRITSVTRRTHIVDNPTNTSAAASNGDGDMKPSRKHEYSWIEIFSESMAWQMVWLRLIVKFVALGCLCYLYTFREFIPPMVLYFVYCWHMYIICSLMFEGIAATVSPLLGIELEAAYDKPFLAHSLANFWGQRWNILISDLLRVSVYDPILLLLCSGTGERSAMKSSTDSPKSTNGVHNNMATPSSNGSAHSGGILIRSCFTLPNSALNWLQNFCMFLRNQVGVWALTPTYHFPKFMCRCPDLSLVSQPATVGTLCWHVLVLPCLRLDARVNLLLHESDKPHLGRHSLFHTQRSRHFGRASHPEEDAVADPQNRIRSSHSHIPLCHSHLALLPSALWPRHGHQIHRWISAFLRSSLFNTLGIVTTQKSLKTSAIRPLRSHLYSNKIH